MRGSHSASREHSSSCSGDQPEYGCDRASRVSPRPPGHDPAETLLRLSAAVPAALDHVPHGQWALLGTDMPLLIDRSACLTPRPVAAHETHRDASLSKVLCSSELTPNCSCRLDALVRLTELTELTALMPSSGQSRSTCASSCCLTATLRPPLQRTPSLPWIHVVTRIAPPRFIRLRFQLRLSSRDPQDFAKRVRQTRSIGAAWLGRSG